MAEISNKTLATLLFFAIVVSLGGTLLSLNKIGQAGGPAQVSITGAAVTGTGSVTISDIAVLDTPGSINFGTAIAVPETQASCLLDSTTGSTPSPACTGAVVASDANRFVIRNHGNVNVDVTASSDKTAAAFMGGTAPSVKWKASIKEATAGTAQIGTFTEITTTATAVVGALKFDNAADEMWFDLQVVVPNDALTGLKSLILTLTACKDATSNTPSFVLC